MLRKGFASLLSSTQKCVWQPFRAVTTTIIEDEQRKIIQLPLFTDNYSYLIIDKPSNTAVAVDPAQPSVVLKELDKQRVNLTDILTTHHHADHAGGNEALSKAFKGVIVYGGERKIQALDRMVKDGDSIEISQLEIQVISTPCHTEGHVVYFLPHTNPPVLFSGDTLFVGGCGRFFEGTSQQMVEALQKLSKLPSETLVCCGHEYTLSNLEFAYSIDPYNQSVDKKLKWATKQRGMKKSTVPSSIAEELKYNPFMRFNDPDIRMNLQVPEEYTDAQVMEIMREIKNQM